MVPVPPDAPIGVSTVYFICAGEKSNEVTFEITP